MPNHSMRVSLAAVAIATALATIGGVALSTQAAAAAARQAPFQPGLRQTEAMTLDEQLLEIARQDSAFGGMFFDEDGRLTMYVRDDVLAAPSGFGRLAGMTLTIESTFRDHPMMAAAETQRVNVLPAQFSFIDLYGWNQAMKRRVAGDSRRRLNRHRGGQEPSSRRRRGAASRRSRA